jgi:co-chaperonin GroES (HSP10)
MLKPLGKRIFCKPIRKVPEKGDIIIPGHELTDLHKVISIGDEVETIKEGDIVLLPSFTTPVTSDGKKFQLVLEGEILAVEV